MGRIRRFALLTLVAYMASRVLGKRGKRKEGREEVRGVTEEKAA